MRTYGMLQYADRCWLLDAEPHVTLRAKRVFGRIGMQQHGILRLTDTVEMCRDLEWFIDRYPLQMSDADRERLSERSAQHNARCELVVALVSGAREPCDFELKLPARDYQRLAADLWLNVGGLLIADDLGIGKTVSAICGLVRADTRPALVVTLTHLQKQWQDELSRFAPELTTHILKRSSPYPLPGMALSSGGQMPLVPDADPLPDVIISSYHKIAGWTEVLATFIQSVVFDECQELRRGTESKKGSAAYYLSSKCQYRCGLSATPFFNYGGEMFNVMEALRPGELGEWEEFTREWCAGVRDKPRIANPKAFGTYLREHGLMLRRTRQDVGRELEPLTKVPQYVDSDTAPLRDVRSAATELARLILGEEDGERGEAWRASEQLSGLVRQATGLAKAPHVADFVRLIMETGESVVLYGWHRSVYDLWLERLADYEPAMFTGSESPAQKEKSKQRFLSGATKLLIISLRAGQGLDGLQQVCRTVVHGELDWSPGVHEQADGRVHRDGQSEPVMSYYLITDAGSDPIVADVLGLKGEQIRGVRDPDGELVERLDVNEDHSRRLAELYLKRET